MEIKRWLCYVVINCALLCCIVAKPFSLNKLIESESELRGIVVHTTTILPTTQGDEPAAERFSLNKGLKSFNRFSKKYKDTGTLHFIPLGKKISPLKYRKTFQIKSPLKPKRVKNNLRTRHKRKNQSLNQEINSHDLLNQKYIPLLKSLGMLFDNILRADSRESVEQTKQKKKRLRYIPDEDGKISCQCPRQTELIEDFEPDKKTVTVSKTLAPTLTIPTQVTTSTTDNPAVSNLRSFRQHKNISLLLPRNTPSTWRNDHGLSERSSTAHNGSAERYISWNNGDREHNTERRQEQSNEESDEEYTDSDTRINASGVRIRGEIRNREHRNNTEEVYENEARTDTNTETKNLLEVREDTAKFYGKYKLETERDKGKSGKLLSKPIPRERGYTSKNHFINNAESLQSEDDNKESVVSIPYDSSSNQRLFDGDGSHSPENQKVNARTEALAHEVIEVTKPEYYSTQIQKPKKENVIFENSTGFEDDYDELNISSVYDSSYDVPVKLDSNITENIKATEKSKLMHPRGLGVKKPQDVFQSPEFKNIFVITAGEKQMHSEENERKDFGTKPRESKQNTESEIRSDITRARGPLVTIIDGYSVTRHKNGENKLAEKAIHIRP